MKLDALRQQPGIVAGVLVGPDGLPLEMIGDGDVLAAELAELRHWINRTGTNLQAGRVTRIAFTTEKLEVVALATGKFVLGAAVTRGIDTRLTQQALAKLALDAFDLPDAEGL